jgi:predicted NBD/HSP70 family sugar kinase
VRSKLSVLVVDIGGSHVKLFSSAADESAGFRSGPRLDPDELMRQVRQYAAAWEYDVVSIGYPGNTGPAGATDDPANLGAGWAGFDFGAAFGRPVRLLNDAAMQALGAYVGGRMLFLGLGTGLGSTLIAERVIVPLELGRLPHKSGEAFAERLGTEGLERLGREAWQETLVDACTQLRLACAADYVVLGGDHAKLADPLPLETRRSGNDDAFAGGVRLWEEWVEHHDVPPSHIWRVVW